MNIGEHICMDSGFFLLFLYHLSIIPIPHRLYIDYYIIYWSYTPYIITRVSYMTSNSCFLLLLSFIPL